MKKVIRRIPLRGLYQLTRYKDHVQFVFIATLSGVLFTNTPLDTPSLVKIFFVFIANFLSVTFAFMINDIEDAPDDALNPAKAKRNPVSAGRISKPMAYGASIAVALSSAFIFYLLGSTTFWIGISALLISAFYSWGLRLKSTPVFDLITHSLMLGSLQMLASYFAFVPFNGIDISWVGPFFIFFSLSMYGELFNELRDFTYDKKAGLKHTAVVIGEKKAYMLMNLLVILGLGTFGYCVIIGLIPFWVIFCMLLIILFIFGPSLLQARKAKGLDITGALQQPALILAMLMVAIWLLGRILFRL